MRLRRLVAILAALSLPACSTLGPYQRPGLTLPEKYPGAAGAGAPGGTGGAIADAWWKEFGDPALDALVDEALLANQDLRAAAARVAEARALVGIVGADRYPHINAFLSASRSKISPETAQLPPSVPDTTSRIRAAGELSFELDFWRRLQRLTDAARADLLATEEGRRTVRLGLVAGVASAYYDLLAFDQGLAIARDTVTTREGAVRLQQARFDAGTISELDLAQAQADLAGAEAAVPILERQVREIENRLAVLLGRIGGTIPRREAPADATAGVAGPLPGIPEGLPSDLLARRPDVVAAEQRVIAAHARIAAARAAYFPRLALTGSGGSESKELSSLFTSGTSIWGIALGLVQPIFRAGQTRAEIAAARAREDAAVAVYAKALQSAFAEVEDALAARATTAVERAAQLRRVEALGRARRLALLRYEAGDSSYLEVLDADRNLFRAQLELIYARRGEIQSLVTLFKALGGGFEIETPPAPAVAVGPPPPPATPPLPTPSPAPVR
jgi:multidrug efflux system outer membrane protein